MRGLFLALLSSAAVAQGAVPAGTVITNIADISYVERGTAVALRSNRVDVRVDELIRFAVTPSTTCASPAGFTAIGFRIANLGNGLESFVPASPDLISGSGFSLVGLFEDSNGNGCYDPGTDQLIAPNERTSPISPGGTLVVFVVGTGSVGPVRVRLFVLSGTVFDAASNTSSGGSGSAGGAGGGLAGVGDGGGSAVVDSDGGTVVGESSGEDQAPLEATLIKTQAVIASDGVATPRRGALVSYSIEGRFSGHGTATGAVIADAIPGGTTYVAGSLSLDGRALSDSQGDDAGDFDGRRVAVRLGDVAAPAIRRMTFQVRID